MASSERHMWEMDGPEKSRFRASSEGQRVDRLGSTCRGPWRKGRRRDGNDESEVQHESEVSGDGSVVAEKSGTEIKMGTP